MHSVWLYTIGPGTQLFERYGHTLLCVRSDDDDGVTQPAGVCTDYGVARAGSGFELVWSTLRGRPIFVATAVTEQLALDTFRGQGRAIERQRLPLPADAAERLASTLHEHVETGFAYAYHPREHNCASTPRDLLDTATGGSLKSTALARPVPVDPNLVHYRDQLEAGLSGHLFELTVAELVTGTPADGTPDAWQAMYLPERLRDGVASYLEAPVESVAPRIDHPLPTSPSIGRGFLLVLAIALYTLARRANTRTTLAVFAWVLGVPALALDALALVSPWPELSHNWLLALLWPTDLALPWLRGRVLHGYVRVRVAVAALFAALELISVVAQPILPVAVMIGVSMLGLWLRKRARDSAASAARVHATLPA